jgi:hypothetical protein
MQPRMGEVLMRSALDPLEQAATLLSGGRLPEALEQLTRDRLLSAFRIGAARVARRAGVGRARVEALFAWHDIDLAAALLETCRAEAKAAWNARPSELGWAPGRVGAQLETQLDTLTGAAEDAAQSGGPLTLLAAAVRRWREVVVSSGALVDENAGLRAAYGWRWARIAATIVAAAATVLWIVSRELSIRAARARVESAIASTDDCRVETIDAEDLRRATDPQRARRDEKKRACDDARAKAEQLARHQASCEALADHLETGQLAGADEALLAQKLPLAKRIVGGGLSADDLALTSADLDCGCPAVAPRMWRAFTKAAASATAAWVQAVRISDALQKSLTADGASMLSIESQRALRDRAEAAAKRGATLGEPQAMEHGAALCDLSRSVGVETGPWCRGLATVMARQSRR